MYPEIYILGFSIPTYPLLYFIAIVTVLIPFYLELKKNGFSVQLNIWLVVSGLIGFILGAKIYGCLEIWDQFLDNPSDTFFIYSGSGWYGGFILGCVIVIVFVKLNNLPLLKILDNLFTYLPLGQVIGRLGCFLSGDGCYGIPSNVCWAMSFPKGLVPTNTRVHPTPVYEMLIYLVIFLILRSGYKKKYSKGIRTSIYLILASLGRFVVEFFRTNDRWLLGLTTPQIITLLLIFLGIVIFYTSITKNIQGNSEYSI